MQKVIEEADEERKKMNIGIRRRRRPIYQSNYERQIRGPSA